METKYERLKSSAQELERRLQKAETLLANIRRARAGERGVVRTNESALHGSHVPEIELTVASYNCAGTLCLPVAMLGDIQTVVETFIEGAEAEVVRMKAKLQAVDELLEQ